MARDVWNELTHYQTTDLVRQLYKSEHSREINTARTKQITSCFIQGQEYFINASRANDSVRPLLLYYGVLALSRGAIQFLDNRSEDTLEPGHGLGISEWHDVFTKEVPKDQRRYKILALECSVSKGTFSELATAVGNKEAVAFPGANFGVDYKTISYSIPRPMPDTARTITFDDVISRTAELARTYLAVTNRQPRTAHGLVSVANEGGFHVCISSDPTNGAPLAVQEIRKLFLVPDEVTISESGQTIHYGGQHYYYLLPDTGSAVLPKGFPHVEDIGGGWHQLTMPWVGNTYLSPLLRCFVISYFLGMLVRYFPSRWMALLRNDDGDASLPLLREAMRYVEDGFPKLLHRRLPRLIHDPFS
jgi:hypothetical protein